VSKLLAAPPVQPANHRRRVGATGPTTVVPEFVPSETVSVPAAEPVVVMIT
jgi:hypothetical protein